jgi:SAM-dependent methyltransferase
MIRGRKHQKAAIIEFRRVLKPGGTIVLHVHNRHFLRELGLRGVRSGEITMPQAYGGAPLTLTHFSRREIIGLLTTSGFKVREVMSISTSLNGQLPLPWLAPGLRAYGYLIAAHASDS